jgi:hypothetical protein
MEDDILNGPCYIEKYAQYHAAIYKPWFIIYNLNETEHIQFTPHAKF